MWRNTWLNRMVIERGPWLPWPHRRVRSVSFLISLLYWVDLDRNDIGLTPLTGRSWPVHGVRISSLYPYIEAEARYACRCEYALTAIDFIARRTRLSFLNVQVTLETLPRVIDIMAIELGWDGKRKNAEFDQAQDFLRSMGLPEVGQVTQTAPKPSTHKGFARR